MQQIVAMVEIKARAEKIGTTLKRLALEAQVNPATAYRAAQGTDCRSSVSTKMLRALTAAELKQRDYLLALHPPGANGAQVAA